MKTTFGYTTGQYIGQYLRLHRQLSESRQRAAACEAEIQALERLPVEVPQDVKRRAQPFLTEAQ